MYGKEPGAPRSEYEGYQTEIREYKRKGVAFEDAMVNDDLANDSIRTKTKTESGNGDDDDETSRQSLDHLGNIEKQWEGAFGDDDTDDKRDDALLDWGGDNIDLREAEALAKQASGKNKTDSSEDDPPLDPGLYLVGTPIGNLEDITLRALRVMRSADFILCEDTRHTKRLLTRYGIDNKLVSYHAHNQFSKRDSLVDYIRSGAALALVSDAGTPAVSDPGADLATACAEQGLPVIPIPGPCAPAAAIVAAGNLTHGEDSFSFIGFLPPKSGARVKRFGQFANAPGSVVAFVPPHKLVRTLEDAAVALGGERKCVVCREMTKVHEEFWRGTLLGAVAEFSNRKPRGEITLVVQGVGNSGEFGVDTKTEISQDALEETISTMLLDGVSPSECAKRCAKLLSVKKKQAYAVALRLAGKVPTK